MNAPEPADEPAAGTIAVPGSDARADAVLAVLAGRPVETVAADTGVEPELVLRWCRNFIDAGRRSLASGGPDDPRTRDRFLALVGHEVRTPLTVIQGWTSILRHVGEDRMDPAVAFDAIDAGLERLERLADDLVDSAAVTLGRLELRLEATDLAVVVADTARSLNDDRIEFDHDGPLPIRGDPTRLRQLIANLLTDGLRRSLGPVSVAAGRHGQEWYRVAMTVRCTPPPFEEMLALFEPFERGSGDIHIGIGLYVSRSLAVAHGGQCGVVAGDDDLTFWVRLPVSGPPTTGDR